MSRSCCCSPPSSDLNIRYWHVMDNGRDSVDLLKRLFDQYEQSARVTSIVQNQLRGDDFEILKTSGLLERAQTLNARVIAIKRLHESSMTKIDAGSNSFWAATQPEDKGGMNLGILERQRVRSWLKSAYEAVSAREPLSRDLSMSFACVIAKDRTSLGKHCAAGSHVKAPNRPALLSMARRFHGAETSSSYRRVGSVMRFWS